MSDRQIAAGEATYSYLEAGNGVPLVLLHGIGSAARSFQAQLDALSARYRVLAWNAPGYAGSSPLPQPHPDAGAYAVALEQFLDALGITACHLLGHSLGTLMATRFAATHPARVLSLTLSSIAAGHAKLSEDERNGLLRQRLDDVAQLGAAAMAEKRGPRLLAPQATPDMVRRVVETMSAVRPDGYAQAARMLSTGDIAADILRLPADMPVQIIVGDADVITPPERNRSIAALRPGTPLHVIPEAGHALYLERPAQFNELVESFIATRR